MDPIAQTTSGTVRGREAGGVSTFQGIPYAAPLDGIRRFQAPAPPEPWDGVRSAVRFSADPPQGTLMPGLPSPWQPWNNTECLTVNVWTPDPSTSGLPVLVWIYGGAFLIGTASEPEYDGAVLARDGAVVVTLNYRVGFEGFGWLPDAPQNRAFLDQLAALRWVRENIAQFGGDPDNVTIFGESAGGTSVAALTACYAGRGLFRRAIGQSIAGGFLPESRARRTSERIAGELGVPATIEGFARLPSEEIHRVQRAPGEITPYGPVIDGDLVRGNPWKGLRAEVDLIAGFTRDEYRLFALNEDLTTKDPAETAARYGVSVQDYRAAYPELSDGDLHVLISSDAIFRMPTVWCAEKHAGHSFCYELTWPTPSLGGALGACHGLDVPLTFGNFEGPMAALVLGDPIPQEAEYLSAEIRKAWLSFAATGDPGWPEFRAGESLTRIWDSPVSVAADPEAASRKIWEKTT
ncbi:carboxylesterase family protein [Amycolatopsis acidicola]|uniref:Carboxylic ester hydrolase n=1 Tax=Amycolatopsis acidicola TaxID=2596893 RepID=A0A5N0VMN0_9PSEU|nr:carboxylesterase family protein [Amycolatopsis acidicola]KAA9166823.1 carboxylesterase family protein [Amycolatopsis acidicola]